MFGYSWKQIAIGAGIAVLGISAFMYFKRKTATSPAKPADRSNPAGPAAVISFPKSPNKITPDSVDANLPNASAQASSVGGSNPGI